MPAVLIAGDDIEDARGQFHDADRVLEPPMRRTGIDHVRHGQLVDVAQSLQIGGVEQRSLGTAQTNEYVDRVTDFMKHLGFHRWSHRPSGSERVFVS